MILEWISNNIGNIIVIVIIAIIVFLSLFFLIKNKKEHKGCCSCGHCNDSCKKKD